jgi:hypothetical protein
MPVTAPLPLGMGAAGTTVVVELSGAQGLQVHGAAVLMCGLLEPPPFSRTVFRELLLH